MLHMHYLYIYIYRTAIILCIYIYIMCYVLLFFNINVYDPWFNTAAGPTATPDMSDPSTQWTFPHSLANSSGILRPLSSYYIMLSHAQPVLPVSTNVH